MTNPNPPPPDAGMECAVEAFMDSYLGGRDWRTAWLLSDVKHEKNRVSKAFAAADRARGWSWIDWRRPEEYEQDPEGKSSRRVLVYVRESHPSDPSYAPEYVVLHWKFRPLTDHMIAWADMPAPPMWPDTLARTATDGEDSPDPAPPETFHTGGNSLHPNVIAFAEMPVPPAWIETAWPSTGVLDGCLFPDACGNAKECLGFKCQHYPRQDGDGRRPLTRPAPFSTEVAKALDFLSDYIPSGAGVHDDLSEAQAAFRLVDNHVRGKNHETPGAAVLAGGESEAYRYLRRVFETCAPKCTPLSELYGMCTQIDNLIAGYRIDLGLMPDPRASTVAVATSRLEIMRALAPRDLPPDERRTWAENRLRELDAAWVLDDKDSAAFVEAVVNPPAPNDALRAAAERYKSPTLEDRIAALEVLLKRIAEIVRGHARRDETWSELGRMIHTAFPAPKT